MIGEDTDSAYTKLAYSMNSTSDLSKEESKPHAHERKKSQHSYLVTWRPQKTEEGQGWQAKEEYVPPLQEVPSQEAPPSWTRQVHVEQEVQELPLQINLQWAWSAFKPHHKFSAGLGGYASKGNKSGDDWWCAGTPKDGENNNGKWITVTGDGKTKYLLNPKPKPKVHKMDYIPGWSYLPMKNLGSKKIIARYST